MDKVSSARGRFYIERDEDGWSVIDQPWGSCLSFGTKAQATDFARFFRAYIRQHGDITLYSAPYLLGDPLHPDAGYLNRHLGNESREYPTCHDHKNCPDHPN